MSLFSITKLVAIFVMLSCACTPIFTAEKPKSIFSIIPQSAWGYAYLDIKKIRESELTKNIFKSKELEQVKKQYHINIDQIDNGTLMMFANTTDALVLLLRGDSIATKAEDSQNELTALVDGKYTFYELKCDDKTIYMVSPNINTLIFGEKLENIKKVLETITDKGTPTNSHAAKWPQPVKGGLVTGYFVDKTPLPSKDNDFNETNSLVKTLYITVSQKNDALNVSAVGDFHDREIASAIAEMFSSANPPKRISNISNKQDEAKFTATFTIDIENYSLNLADYIPLKK